jgi:N-methylhydantoinase A/oxoprolinase/acetone carboxylase beta subunit
VIENLANKIDRTSLETASGIIQIANANMEKAVRVISIERGYDPRDFALVSFGGAGGMHAMEIASSLNIAKVIVPKNAGVLSAMGLLMADSIKDYSQSFLKPFDTTTPRDLEKCIRELQEKSYRDMKNEGFSAEDIQSTSFLDLRYLGQSYEITLPYRPSMSSHTFTISAFHKAHQRLYSYFHSDRPVELVNIRLRSIGVTKKIRLKKRRMKERSPQKASLFKKQPLFFGGKKYAASVYIREKLEPGNRISGPALIVDQESTTFLPPQNYLCVDGLLNLVMEKAPSDE